MSRLRALLKVIDDECKRNPQFFSRIEDILLSPEAVVATQKKTAQITKPTAFNILEILHSAGEEEARKKLNEQTNSELAKLAAAEGIKKLNEAKAMGRDPLIDLLIERSHSRLKQGETFTKG